MINRTPKYALIDGREVALVESIPHALSNETVCVFEDGTDNRRYVSEAEWVAGRRSLGAEVAADLEKALEASM